MLSPYIFRAFIYAGAGVMGEVTFTAIKALWQKRDWGLQGYTQLWVYPMYASAVLVFEPLHEILRSYNFLLRGLVYGLVIFACEYVVCFIAKLIIGRCPWEYKGRWNIHGYVNLPHLPFWAFLGLIFEQLHNFLLTIKF